MYHFKYVSKNEIAPMKKEIIELIHHVQNEVRNYFTFQYEFIGSVKRNMVTYDIQSNIGFDFDVNITVNDDDEEYSAKEIKHILMRTFNEFSHRYHYDSCEDSTRVFTIKVKDTKNSRILYSCDFAIVKNYGDCRQEHIGYNKRTNFQTCEYLPNGFYYITSSRDFYDINYGKRARNRYIPNTNEDKESIQKYIRFDKKSNTYTWEEQPKGFYLLPEKIEFCKDNSLWQEVRDTYIQKKNTNTDKNKKSRSIFADTIHQVCQKNRYFDK